MFSNVGKKIQGVVTTIFLVEFIVSCIVGIAIGSIIYKSSDSIGAALLVGLIVIAIGIFFSWLSLLLLYAFGRIEESCEEQCALLRQLVASQSGNLVVMEPTIKKCPKCNAVMDNDSVFCSACGTKYTN